MPGTSVVERDAVGFEVGQIQPFALLRLDPSVFEGEGQHLSIGDVQNVKNGDELNALCFRHAPIGQHGVDGVSAGQREGGHPREVELELGLLQRLHAHPVHPVGFSTHVAALAHVHRQIEGFTGEQVQAHAQVLCFADVTAHVNGQAVNEIVHHRAEIHDVSEEERQRFNPFAFIERGQFQTVRVHIGGQRERNVGGQRIEVDPPVQAEERIGVIGVILKGNAERRRGRSNQLNHGIAFRTA